MNSKLPDAKMSQKKALGNPEKQVNPDRNCSSISWFVILTCSVLTLFLIFLNSSMFTSDGLVTIYNKISKNPSAKIFDAENSAEKSAEKSENPSDNKSTADTSANQSAEKQYNCTGKYIHILDLPSEFNTDLLKNCKTLSPFTDKYCEFIKNNGFGPKLKVSDKTVFSESGWYSTDQFMSEIIFHNRLKHYRCLTNDSSKASAIFVPYYAGIDVARYLWGTNVTLRDAVSVKFAKFVQETHEWKKMGGRDHFLVLGRVAGDFGRNSEIEGWGNRLTNIPGIRNMTTLLIESSLSSKSEVAIPYPTYFHPSSQNEVDTWQDKMRKKRRRHLFSFAGGPRPNMKGSIRNELIKQCVAANGYHNCKFMDCSSKQVDCRMAETVMRLFQSSDFCLQPPGDSFTRKSFFDTILSGCIPIVFHPASAYVQYQWHLPKDYSSYSVFLPLDEVKNGLSITWRLAQIPREKVNAMREEVIKLIPRIIYANVDSNVEDAFEVTIKGVLDRVEMFKKEMKEGKNLSYDSVPEGLAWKYNYFGDLDHHEWDKYFDGSISIY